VLERLAGEATVYERAQSASPWTLPSHASLFTGMRPSEHGANETHYRLEDGPETVAEVLGRAGYETVAISANDMVGPAAGLARGFGRFLSPGHLRPEAESASRLPGPAGRALKALDAQYRRRARFRFDYGAARVSRLADRALSRIPDDRPVFLFVNLLDAHLRYWPPEPHRGRFLPREVSEARADAVDQSPKRFFTGESALGPEDFEILRGLYRGEIAYLDARLGELMGILQRHGRWDRSLFALTSDHGENIGDHGLMDHQSCVYQTLLSVPLVLRHPGGEAGARSGALVQTHDLAPTLLAAAGTAFERPVDAVALPREGAGRDVAVSEYLTHFPSVEIGRKTMPEIDWSRFDRGFASVRDANDLKLIAATDGDRELYDLATDPGETRNLFAELPGDAARLGASVPAWAGAAPEGPAMEELEMEDHLRTLGYIE
jgi:arylsulfatase A-like enzyme